MEAPAKAILLCSVVVLDTWSRQFPSQPIEVWRSEEVTPLGAHVFMEKFPLFSHADGCIFIADLLPLDPFHKSDSN